MLILGKFFLKYVRGGGGGGGGGMGGGVTLISSRKYYSTLKIPRVKLQPFKFLLDKPSLLKF